MEWMTKSSLPNLFTACCTKASSSPGSSTLQFTNSTPMGAVNGSTHFRAFSFRHETTTSAPCARTKSVQPHAMDRSLARPKIKPFFPAKLNAAALLIFYSLIVLEWVQHCFAALHIYDCFGCAPRCTRSERNPAQSA
ncbi:hypothetical protein D3C72_1994130 [compost metagenome]